MRDVGGPVFALKRAIDEGVVPGPRIYPSGAMLSQTGGHGDFRLPYEVPRSPGEPLSHAEQIGAVAIADGPDEVRLRAREQLRQGASQLKLMAGGGVASPFDPLDVTQYTEPEVRAAVEAAENWGTYVAVHAYTPRAIRMAVDAGVRCIEHGHLIDVADCRAAGRAGRLAVPAALPGRRGRRPPSPDSIRRRKQLELFAGTDTAYGLAKRHGLEWPSARTSCSTPGWPRARGRSWPSWRVGTPPPRCSPWPPPATPPCWPCPGRVIPIPAGWASSARVPWPTCCWSTATPLADLGLLADPGQHLVAIMKGGQLVKYHQAKPEPH